MTNQKQETSFGGESSSEEGLNQIMEAGVEASKLLNSPIYQVAHRMSLDQVITEWSQTSPKEREKRESLYHELRALGSAAQILAGMVGQAQQASQQSARNDPQSQYLDKQGFGL